MLIQIYIFYFQADLTLWNKRFDKYMVDEEKIQIGLYNCCVEFSNELFNQNVYAMYQWCQMDH